MKTVWKWIILTALMAYVVTMTVWANAEADKHKCRGISVSITGGGILYDSITTSAVLDLLRQYPEKIVGVTASRVNTLGIEKYLMDLNNFEDVRCHMTSQGYLSVNIQPMIPEIRVFDGEDSYYVNKDGKRLDSNSAFYVDVPVVSGNFDKISPKSILPVVRFVERDSVLHNLITMYVVKDKDNILLVPRFTGHIINFGDSSRLVEKRRALLTAYHNILPYRGWELYDTISVKFKGQIVASRRDKRPLFPFETIIEEEDPEEASLPDDPNPEHQPSTQQT